MCVPEWCTPAQCAKSQGLSLQLCTCGRPKIRPHSLLTRDSLEVRRQLLQLPMMICLLQSRRLLCLPASPASWCCWSSLGLLGPLWLITRFPRSRYCSARTFSLCGSRWDTFATGPQELTRNRSCPSRNASANLWPWVPLVFGSQRTSQQSIQAWSPKSVSNSSLASWRILVFNDFQNFQVHLHSVSIQSRIFAQAASVLASPSRGHTAHQLGFCTTPWRFLWSFSAAGGRS